MKIKGQIFFSVIAIAILAGAYFPKYYNNTEKEQVLINTIMEGLRRLHYQPEAINDEFSKKVYKTYLERIDGGKRFFTKEQIAQLEEYEVDIDDETNAGSYQFFDTSMELLNNQLKKTQLYYRDILSKPFDFNSKDYVETDGDKKVYARNDQALKEAWFKQMKYEVLSRLSSKIQKQEQADEEEDEVKEEKKSIAELEAETREEVLDIYDKWYERLFKLKRSDRLSDYLNAITNTFDPHTGYFEPIDKQNFDITMSGKLEGIGARLQTEDNYTKVSSIVVGGPAWKGKDLEKDDIIMKVAQGDEEAVDIAGMVINDVVKLIRGKKGTTVNLTVKKVDGTEAIISIVRDVVVIEEGFAKSLILNSDKGEKIGYLKLPRFYADFGDSEGRFCSKDVETEIEKLKSNNVQGIILDLRNNGGGSLRDVVKMSGFFIEEGPVVQVKSRGRNPEILEDTNPDVQYDGPLIVMVNEFSASASEILAAALQDYNRAVIVGSASTFGKGTVQRFFDLDRAIPGNQEVKPLGHIKLTTQKFYRINGGSTQFEGVHADIVLPDNYKYVDTGEKEHNYPLPWDEIDPADYEQDVMRLGNMNSLIANSQKRVATNEIFQKIERNAKRVMRQREVSSYPLSFEEYSAMDKKVKEEAKEYKDMFTKIESLKVSNLKQDVAAIESNEGKKARNEDWLKSVNKDVYIYETMSVMHDLIVDHIADNHKK